jgi:hypothetical protein
LGTADFSCELSSIRATLYRDAREHDLKVKSSFIDDHNGREAIAFKVEKNGNKASDSKQEQKKS